MKRQVLTANAVEQSFTGLKQLIVSNLCTDRNKLTLYCEPRFFVCVSVLNWIVNFQFWKIIFIKDMMDGVCIFQLIKSFK